MSGPGLAKYGLVAKFQHLVRKLVGLNHVNARFDALDGTLGTITCRLVETSRRIERIDAGSAKMFDWFNNLQTSPNLSAPPAAGDRNAPAMLIVAADDDKGSRGGKSSQDADINSIQDKLDFINHNLYSHLKEASRVRELYYRDIMIALDRVAKVYPEVTMSFAADRAVAIDSDDHLKPWGAAHDNTRSPRLVAACERRFRRSLTFLDLGCSGGGLVLDFILRGHRAYGVEGSDHPKLAQRAEWRVLRNNLFTADITRRFRISELSSRETIKCDVISMWEVLEHIADDALPLLFENILAHMKPDGIFMGSIALRPDDCDGASYHRTVQSREWWVHRFAELGMPMLEDHGFAFEDFARGTNNGPLDGNFSTDPGLGFHFVAARPTPSNRGV